MKAGKILSLLFLLILILFLWSVATSDNEGYSPDYMDPNAYNFLAGEIRPSDASINPLML